MLRLRLPLLSRQAALPGLLAAAKDIYNLLDKQFRKHPVPLDVFTRLYRAIALAEGRMSI